MSRSGAAPREVPGRAPRRWAGTALALTLLAAPAAACPYCSLSQGADTLVYVMAFLAIPYAIVAGTWWWMKRVLAQDGGGPRA